MQPIYFPFTFMPEPVADVLAVWFDRMTLLSLSKKETHTYLQSLLQKGWLSFHSPGNDDDALDDILTSYRAWADLHGGAQLEQFMTQKIQTRIHTDASVYQLLDEIKLRSREPGGGKKKSRHPDADIQKNRILLSIAHEFDRNNWEIQKDLARVMDSERDFLRHLHATEDGATSQLADPLLWPEGSVPSHMLIERLRAWNGFLLQKELPYRIFVTTSQPVVDQLVQVLPTTEPLALIIRIPVRTPEDRMIRKWREKLAQWMADQLTTGEMVSKPFPEPPKPESGEQTTSLIIYRTMQSPLEWFRKAIGDEDHLVPDPTNRPEWQATLLAHVIHHGD